MENTKKITQPSFWRDERFLKVIGQIIFVLILAIFFGFIYSNMINGLQRQGMTLGLDFLTQTAGFDLGESLIEYGRTDIYIVALFAGLLNTLVVSLLGIFFSTVLGVIIGVARLSSNFIVNKLAQIYIEIFRNVSLLVFLIFWYSGIFLKLPRVKEAFILWDGIFFSNRGVGIPWGIPTETYQTFTTILIAGFIIALLVASALIYRGKQTGRMPLVWVWASLTFFAVATAGWFILPQAPLAFEIPHVAGLKLTGGKILSPEFMALLSGLVIYTSAFIAEIVRAGILAVSRGQWEASRALGLNPFQVLRLIIFPQALRVIIPPLTSQYLNLTKNSSLAVAIGYPDLFYVSSTVINQSGRAVEMITIIMLTYLSFSLLTSLFMNWYNARIRLVER